MVYYKRAGLPRSQKRVFVTDEWTQCVSFALYLLLMIRMPLSFRIRDTVAAKNEAHPHNKTRKNDNHVRDALTVGIYITYCGNILAESATEQCTSV